MRSSNAMDLYRDEHDDSEQEKWPDMSGYLRRMIPGDTSGRESRGGEESLAAAEYSTRIVCYSTVRRTSTTVHSTVRDSGRQVKSYKSRLSYLNRIFPGRSHCAHNLHHTSHM